MRRSNDYRVAKRAEEFKRIAIFHISIGAGHKRAAQAIELAIKERRPDIEVQVVDMLTFADAGTSRPSLYTLLAKKGYMNFIQYRMGAAIYGYFFESTNKKSTSLVSRAVALVGGGYVWVCVWGASCCMLTGVIVLWVTHTL